MQFSNKFPYDGKRILVLGCGGVCQCTLPLLLRHIDIRPENITVIDMVDNREAIADALAQGVQYVQEKITREKFRSQFSRYIGPGDLILDLSWNLDTVELLDWCHANQVRYLNTSVELWDPYAGADELPVTARTLYHRQMELRKLVAKWGRNDAPTAVVDHGANPGLVSHFTKMGLIDIAHRLLAEHPSDRRARQLHEALEQKQFNRLAHLLGVKVIHISERDTQISCQPREDGEFVNTWSIEGFYEEGIAPAEMGWGTHEKMLPHDAWQHKTGPRNQICLERFGIDTFVRSWVPCGEIVGMVVRHGEAFSISDTLTVYDATGKALYRPTVHYAYCPSDAAIESLHEMRTNNYTLQPKHRLMNDDIVSGRDELGCLLMGHDFKSWWIGSLLDIEETRRLVPGRQNATTLQVACSVLGTVAWMIRNPSRGFNLPDQLPHEEIMEIALPYLGPFVSQPVDWSPGDSDSWQFGDFEVEAEEFACQTANR